MMLNPTKGVPPMIVRRLDAEREPNRCAWFLECQREAYADVTHPTLGEVPICAEHLEWLQQ